MGLLVLCLQMVSVIRAQSELPLTYDRNLVREIGQQIERADVAGAKRGAELFFSQRANCQGCHRVMGFGGMVGPDLSKIGQTRTVDLLIESVLWPARQIDASYRLTTLVTDEGKSIQGWLQHETTEAVKLKDPTTGEVHLVEKSTIDDRSDGGTLMPSRLTDRLNRNALVDLLAFLSNYRWTKNYGSKDYSVADPEKQGRDAVEITGVRLSADGRLVTLEIPELKTVMQMMIDYKLSAENGTPMVRPIFSTINKIEETQKGQER